MFLIFLTFTIFAAAICVNKVLLGILPPTLFVGIRMSLSGIILFAYSWKHKSNLKYIKSDWLLLCGIALFTTFIPSILKAYGLAHLNASHATLLGSIDPFVTALYSYILWREKLNTTKTIGIVIGCIGLLLSLNLSNIGTQLTIKTILPQVALIVSILFSRWGWILVQMLLRKNRYQPAQLNSLVMTSSGLIALAVSPTVDNFNSITVTSITSFVLLFAFTIIIGNVIGYTMYSYVLKHNNATFISLAGFSIPILVGFYSKLFLGEKITLQFVIAAIVLFSGLVIFYYDEIKRQRITRETK